MFDSYRIKRNDVFIGKELHFGESNHNYPIRLSCKLGEWKRPIHETWQNTGSVGILTNPIYHQSASNMSAFIQKINTYAQMNAQYLFKMNQKSHWYSIIIYPTAKFIKNYFYYQGFRDGTHGFVHAMSMSLHSFLTRATLWQLQEKDHH